jgi:AraC-like DNA-binding protein
VLQGSTIASVQVTYLFEALRKLGADPIALSARVGLPAMPPQDPDERVPSSRLLALLELAGRQLHDPLIGLHAGAVVETRGPLFYLLLSSPRMSDGLQLFSRFARIPLDTQRLDVTIREGVVDLTIDPGDPAIEQSHNAVDYMVGNNISSLRRGIPGFRLLRVDLMHREVGEPGTTALTFGCPVRFGRRHNTLRFPDATLDNIPVAANPAIAEQIEKYTSVLFAKLTAASVHDRVTDAIRAQLVAGIPPDRAAVARRLHVSERTLQRQLEQESTTFKVLRDSVRSELSRALLSNRALKVEAIAQSMGFAEAASFSKAFTRWSGHPPTRYREQLDRRRATP